MASLTLPIFGLYIAEIRVSRRTATRTPYAPELDAARASLIDRIEQGYVVDGTDRHVELPAYAKAYAKTLAQFDM